MKELTQMVRSLCTGLLPAVCILLSISSCNTYTVYKGTHFSVPPQYFDTKKGISGNITITDKMEYVLNGEDQFDFNKLVGLKFNYFKPME